MEIHLIRRESLRLYYDYVNTFYYRNVPIHIFTSTIGLGKPVTKYVFTAYCDNHYCYFAISIPKVKAYVTRVLHSRGVESYRPSRLPLVDLLMISSSSVTSRSV